jgi:hypothetical protein
MYLWPSDGGTRKGRQSGERPDDLHQIAALRARQARGELDALPQVRLNEDARAGAGLVAGAMLDEIENLSPDEYNHVDSVVRRRSLLWDLCWLRQQIG